MFERVKPRAKGERRRSESELILALKNDSLLLYIRRQQIRLDKYRTLCEVVWDVSVCLTILLK